MDSHIVISSGRIEVLNLFAICRNQDIYLSRGFCIPFMYLHWALLHCSRCDWWLIDCMGHRIHCHLDCVLSILPQLATELHFWIQFESGQVWGLRIWSGSEQTDSNGGLLGVDTSPCVFFFTSLSLTALRWHSVAVESRTLPECQYQPLFTNKQTKMPNASRTQRGDTELSLALSRK